MDLPTSIDTVCIHMPRQGEVKLSIRLWEDDASLMNPVPAESPDRPLKAASTSPDPSKAMQKLDTSSRLLRPIPQPACPVWACLHLKEGDREGGRGGGAWPVAKQTSNTTHSGRAAPSSWKVPSVRSFEWVWVWVWVWVGCTTSPNPNAGQISAYPRWPPGRECVAATASQSSCHSCTQ